MPLLKLQDKEQIEDTCGETAVATHTHTHGHKYTQGGDDLKELGKNNKGKP